MNSRNSNSVNSNSEEKLLNLIGLCKRAGKITCGEQAVLDSIKRPVYSFIIIANDASEGTLKKITDKCKSYNKDYIIFSDRYTLGKYTKREYAVTVSVNDINFAKRIHEIYCENYS